MTWKEAHEKYKNYKLPEIGEVFTHPTEFRGDRIPIEYRVLKYTGYDKLDDKGLIETVHSGRKVEKTLHWIRKTYNKES